VIPVRPSAALVVTQGAGTVRLGRGTARYADDLNLRAYAQSEVCIYGQTQQALTAVHLLAKKERAAVVERRRRPRTLWIGEGQEGDSDRGPILFTGYSIEGIKKQLFHVDPRARAGNRFTPDDMWK
jgi:hypothetical protein